MAITLPEQFKIVDATAGSVTTNGGVTGDYVSLKNAVNAWLILQFTQAVAHQTVIQPKYATLVDGTGVTNITHSARFWYDSTTASVDALTAWRRFPCSMPDCRVAPLHRRKWYRFSPASKRRRIFALYDAVWRDLPQRIELAAALGAHWTEVSTPFVALAGDEVVAHVGVITIPLVLDGMRTTVAGIHAVGTHPAHRGRGHIRRLLGEALAFCDERLETAQLTTRVPEVFRPHGFRRVPQHRFAVAVPAAREGAGMTRLRHTNAADVALLWRLLQTRAPVSSRLGVVEPRWLFVIDEIFAQRNLERVHYIPDLDAALVLEIDGATARLYDLVAPRLPRLAAVLRRLPASVKRVELYFTPDGLDLEGAGALAVEPAWPEDNVMVRGPYAAERTGLPFILPALAHC